MIRRIAAGPQKPGSTSTFGLFGNVVFDTNTVGTSARSTGQSLRARSRKRSSVSVPKKNRDDQRRLERGEHFHHAVEVERVITVDRRHDHVDAADGVELLLRQGVMQMAEMSDAHIGDFEDEDGIAVAFGAAAPIADIGRHVAHAHVLVCEVPDGRFVRAVAPATQHVFDRRIGMVGVVGVVSVVHGGDVGDDGRLHIVVVVGRDAHLLRALDQECGVADEGKPHLIRVERGEIKCGGHDRRPAEGDEAGTIFPHLRLRRRGGVLRGRGGKRAAGKQNNDERGNTG